MLYFTVCFVLFTLTVGAFLSLMIWVDAKGWKKFVGCCFTSVLIGLFCAGMFQMEHNGNINKWNDGYCPTCGEQWKLVNVEHRINSGTHYYYTCENCGIVIDLTQIPS
jgi:hypothetical protein